MENTNYLIATPLGLYQLNIVCSASEDFIIYLYVSWELFYQFLPNNVNLLHATNYYLMCPPAFVGLVAAVLHSFERTASKGRVCHLFKLCIEI